MEDRHGTFSANSTGHIHQIPVAFSEARLAYTGNSVWLVFTRTGYCIYLYLLVGCSCHTGKSLEELCCTSATGSTLMREALFQGWWLGIIWSRCLFTTLFL